MVVVPGLGEIVRDKRRDVYVSRPFKLAVLNGTWHRLVLQGYDTDPAREDFHTAMANFLRCTFRTLQKATPYVFQQYQDANVDEEFVTILTPAQVWQHIQFVSEPVITRRAGGDQGIYISIACECAWEPENGLQIVLKNGERVSKIGPYDGHLTHSDAYADKSLEDVVYQ